MPGSTISAYSRGGTRKLQWGSRTLPEANLRATTIQTVVRKRQAQNNYKNLKLSKPVKTLVDRRINKSEETHTAYYLFRPYQFTNLIADNPAQRIWQVMPNLARGTERTDRIGSEIRPYSLRIKGRVMIPADQNPLLGNDDRAQIYIRLMVLSWKMCKNLDDVESNWTSGQNLNNFFFKPGASGQAPTGLYSDMLLPINHDMLTTHFDKVYKMNRHYPFFPDPTSTSGAASQIPVSKEFNINVKCKNKKLCYVNEADVQPSNFAPFVCALFCYGNGANPSSVSAVPYVEYLSTLRFKP